MSNQYHMIEDWHPANGSNENAVQCAGCGATCAVAECTVATIKGPAPWNGGITTTAIFACSPDCEEKAAA